jgi:tripartite-type tricarboxylate transporter receptor subunit TctC
MRVKAVLVVAGVLLATATLMQQSPAQPAWPDRPIRLIVPVAAGGGIDLMARILAEGLSQQLPQRVIVENMGGAGGLLATRMVAKADPDGYTFLFSGPAHASLPYVTPDPGYDVRADFTSVSLVARFPLVLVTNPKSPARNTAEFIAMVKATPGKYSFGSSSIGGASHIPLEAFKFQADLDMIHVPYRGSGQTTAALLTGEIDLVCDGLAPQLAHIREGRVRPLGITTKSRSPYLPDMPTIAETLPGYAFPMWVALFAPAKTPKPIIEKMFSAVAAATASPLIKKRYEDLLVEPVASTPEALAQFLDEQLAFNKDIIEKAKIRVQ